MEHRAYTKKNRKDAFTLAEFLVVIAITMILAGVSFVAAIRYQSRLRRMEMDRTAKEIFLAAQNNLSLAKSGGIMERLLNEGSEEKLGILLGEDQSSLYYILYQPGEDGQNTTDEIRQRLLPFGSIDETVRTDGSYLIIYNPSEGSVRKVWYSDRYKFQDSDLSSDDFEAAAQDPAKRERYQGEAIGYYSGDGVSDVPSGENVSTVEEPMLEIQNRDILYVYVADKNRYNNDVTTKLFMEGLSSGAKGSLDLKSLSKNPQTKKQVLWMMTYTDDYGAYRVILDDISTDNGRFADLNKDSSIVTFENDKRFIPGEDIRLYAKSYIPGKSNSEKTSEVMQTNSIFAGKRTDKVLISCTRHLENLDFRISGFNPVTKGAELGLEQQTIDGNPYYVASQQEDISWNKFSEVVQPFKESADSDVYVCYFKKDTDTRPTHTAKNSYAPVEPNFPLWYEGNLHGISDLVVKDVDTGGCFGTVTQNLAVNNLKIVSPNISSEYGAGGLIGSGTGNSVEISVDHVLVQYPMITSTKKKSFTVPLEVDAGALIGAFNGKNLTVRKSMAANTYRENVTEELQQTDLSAQDAANLKIQSDYGSAGGLIGSISAEGTVLLSGCAASVYVEAGSYAGGLVASVSSGNVTIENSYVGGHTSEGKFLTELKPTDAEFYKIDEAGGVHGTIGRYNIVANQRAGGIAAIVPDGTTISHTYVTASVWSNGMNAQKADQERNEAAFIARWGGINSDSGKEASDSAFSYCYSACEVMGENVSAGRVLKYSNSDQLEKYFKTDTTDSGKKALPYDETLYNKTLPDIHAIYPMPTVVQLIQEDPDARDIIKAEEGVGTSQSKQLPKFVRVHIGDWMQPEKEEPTENGLTINNGNRLWVDYVMDMPEDTGTATSPVIKYVTFSINELSLPEYKENDKDETITKSIYYVVAVNCSDLKAVEYNVLDDATKVTATKWNENGSIKDWNNPSVSKRIECTVENGKLKIRFYLDNLALRSAGYQALPSLYNSGNLNTLKAGANVKIGACEEIRIPDESTFKRCNSLFAGIEPNEDGTYTAFIANARHLENLNFFGSKWQNPSNRITVTKAIQTDNILWHEDDEISSDTRAYCEDLMEAYGSNQIYNGPNLYTHDNSFFPIENDELLSYDGQEHTISKLEITKLQDGNTSSALFQNNPHLHISNLNLKDPVIESAKNAAVVIAGTAVYGQWGNYISGGESLNIENVHVYGDNARVMAGLVSGGIAASVDVDEFVMQDVTFYGKNAIIGSVSVNSQNSTNAGGLVGYLKAAKSVEMENSMFSGYIDGSRCVDGTGGLIGRLELTEGPDIKPAQIKNCYVAGRNNPSYAQSQKASALTEGVSITGYRPLGGLLGWVEGSVKITNSFSTAGLYDVADGWRGGFGGLIGKYDGKANMQLNNCYFVGKLSSVSENWDTSMGILVGRVENTETTNRISFSNCAYLKRTENQDKNIIGSIEVKTDNNVAACASDKTGKKNLWPSLTDTSYASVTYPYDSNLKDKTYPYKIWTTEDGVKTYRGDWITQ